MKLDGLRITVIGAGAMGEAMIGGLLRHELVTPDQITATGPRSERRAELERRYGIHTTADNVAAARWGQVVIVSVKPQTLPKVLVELRGALQEGELVISGIAGTPIRTFVEELAHSAVVRSMSNTPAQIGEGMTVWTASAAVTEEQRGWARMVLGSLGRELYVTDENYLDIATAINGPGPGYFFMVMEAMIDAGVHLGLPRYMAHDLVLHTMLGSVRYAMQSERHPAELRNAVTSPGGTTAAALYELERCGLRTVLTDAIWAAYRRSAELGKSK
ncbi:MAG TPA: pyrroline-5-carboxylate reductase [Roseiflexaceae bacterium]|nr:pyrroline-5-carboxylate reductase [Roseiflexaceae bacterium]